MVTATGLERNPGDRVRVGALEARTLLEALSEMEPERSETILRDAGLDRVRFATPPNSPERGLTRDDEARLIAAVRERLGETLTRSFLTVYGRRLADRLRTEPSVGDLRKAALDIATPGDRLTWAVRAAAKQIDEPGNPLEVVESESEIWLSRGHCAACARVLAARAPICAHLEEVLTALIRELIGGRASAIEFECHAQGAERCRYRVRR